MIVVLIAAQTIAIMRQQKMGVFRFYPEQAEATNRHEPYNDLLRWEDDGGQNHEVNDA
jgi:hypothetical protein